MEFQEQSEREACRVIALGCNGTQVLLSMTEAGFVFPFVEIPRWQRTAESLTSAFKKDWGRNAVCLFTPKNSEPVGDSNGNHYEVVECSEDEARKDETAWKLISSLTACSFRNEAEFGILQECLHELDGYERDPSSPFAKKGWLATLQDWTADAIGSIGLRLTGPWRQLNAGPAFSLIRFETNRQAVWFKAVGEPNQREFPITLQLAELFPKFMPQILATGPKWNGWLSCEVEGTNLGDTKDIALWEEAATEFAKLQIEAIPSYESVLRSGAHDLRPETLVASIDPFFDVITELMEQQLRVPPPNLSQRELSLLKLRVHDSFTLLDGLQIPNALGHLDLNPWNIIISSDRCAFLDWAEAYVGPPFFSFEYLLQHFRREICADAALESQFLQAYMAPWRQLLAEGLLGEALALAPLAAVFAYAVGTSARKDMGKLRDPETSAYFRSLARRMNREAIQVVERRPACTS